LYSGNLSHAQDMYRRAGHQQTLTLALHRGLQSMADSNVVHFDLKGDNVFLDALLPGSGVKDLLDAPTERLPFRVVVGDFGEACILASPDEQQYRYLGPTCSLPASLHCST
jgi:serine/threonine protein kinase